jgi:phospholipid-binding lipoprotein MlaA
MWILRYVDHRSDLLRSQQVLESAAIDPYVFTRDSYLQRRRYLVYDGDPPMEEDFFDGE